MVGPAAFLPLITAAMSQAGAGAGAAKQAGEVSKELLGYDFPGLLVKLFVYFTAAYIFAKFMEFVLHATGFFKWFVDALGLVSLGAFKVQDPPQILKDLFLDGYNGVKYWDLIKGIAIVAVGFEAYMYYKSNKDLGGQPSVMTLAIFGVIETGLIMITIPEILQRISGGFGNKLTLSLSSGGAGSTFDVTVTGLKANTSAEYGWIDSGGTKIYSKQIAIGSLFGVTQPFTFPETLLSSTAPGTYTIYYDQRAGGGPYYTATFIVTGGIAA